MDPIFSYSNHPSLKYETPSTIYLLAGDFYWATQDQLVKIKPTAVRYTNMGEPFRQLAEFSFKLQALIVSESIDVSMEDAATLVGCCRRLGLSIEVDSELTSYSCFQTTLEKY